MPNRSTESKQRWNAEHYTQLKISIKPEIAESFKATCAASGVSMASILSKYMADYSHAPCKKKVPADPYATRKKRRGIVNGILSQMEQLAHAEKQYRDNIPENLKNSMTYDAADQSVSVLYEVIDLLQEVY